MKEKEKKMSKCHTSKQHRGIFLILAKKIEMAIFHIVKDLPSFMYENLLLQIVNLFASIKKYPS